MKNTLLFSGLITAISAFVAFVLFIVAGMLTNCFGMGCSCYKVFSIALVAIMAVSAAYCIWRNCKHVVR